VDFEWMREADMYERSGEGGFGRDRFDTFTDEARQALHLAQEEAQRFNHNYIGTEHLLLGLTRVPGSVAEWALRELGVSLDKARSAVELVIGRGDRIVLGDIGLTPRAKKVMELAVDEARRLNHHYIGTEHLLLGLIREGEGIAARVLGSLGVSLERAREQVLRALAERSAGGDASPMRQRTPITCWFEADELATLDALVETGVHPSREEAAAWLIREGLAARRDVLERIGAKVAEIERLRAEARALARGDDDAGSEAPRSAPSSVEPLAPSDDESTDGPTPAV
jgi:ATP-dependent Clp protease ATP-binding subunit ClpA